MEWDFTYGVAGETLLANAPRGTPHDTNFVRAPLCPETPIRLTIARRIEDIPGANAPGKVQLVEGCLTVLAGADIRLKGDPAGRHCSLTVDDTALPPEEERNDFLEAAIEIIRDALSCLLGVKMPLPF